LVVLKFKDKQLKIILTGCSTVTVKEWRHSKLLLEACVRKVVIWEVHIKKLLLREEPWDIRLKVVWQHVSLINRVHWI
jgi:hypothetical protein